MTTGLSPGQEALFVPGCRPVERRLFVYVNPFHARYVREPADYLRFITGLSVGREALFVLGCRPVGGRLFVSLNPFHARHVREKARVARFHAAQPALRGFRSSERPSASVTRSPPIGMTFSENGGLFWPSSFLRSVGLRSSHGNSVAHRPQAVKLRNSYF